ncbi:hypothetical protein OC846_000137 [Tilletia horrida]|uniref:Uncharacterized protein n=1 Tax=Tilletia horrida TaxID=155126 RepID=A0AAN6GYN1_9BASI|nr:hypothetical protein OC846_000137 [Tilletia horrida]KAK0570115.1 hypothetical protein OC861_000257 [Tilletia horrida]
MKFISSLAVVLVSASLVAAEPVVHATPAPVRRQALPSDLGDFTSVLDPNILSSNYAQATSALSSALAAGAPSSAINSQLSSLNQVYSSAFAAASSVGGASTYSQPSTSSSGSSGNKGAAVHGVSFDLPISLALTGFAGLLAAVVAL